MVLLEISSISILQPTYYRPLYALPTLRSGQAVRIPAACCRSFGPACYTVPVVGHLIPHAYGTNGNPAAIGE